RERRPRTGRSLRASSRLPPPGLVSSLTGAGQPITSSVRLSWHQSADHGSRRRTEPLHPTVASLSSKKPRCCTPNGGLLPPGRCCPGSGEAGRRKVPPPAGPPAGVVLVVPARRRRTPPAG